jgi:cytoskeletal protein CcmA (bactofilin family)/predicted RNA-binding Zn-ribbon protein involved in translation (DUF1610 family)
VAKQNKPRQAEKISADCPHCGFTQLESAYAKSTFCRKCGKHYNIEKVLAKEATSLKGPSLIEKLTKLVVRESIRDVTCFSCGHHQTVTSAAQSSLCPQCGSYIDLRDFKISGVFGRTIQTQGEIIVLAKGEISSAKVSCHSAVIEGKLRGTLFATHEVRIRTKERILGAIDTNRLIIEKRAHCEFVRPVKAQAVEISGKVSAMVWSRLTKAACSKAPCTPNPSSWKKAASLAANFSLIPPHQATRSRRGRPICLGMKILS